MLHKHTFALLVVASYVVMMPAVTSYVVSFWNSHCYTCNHTAMEPEVFQFRYLSACLTCGEFYGSAVEHCCLCHPQVYDQCLQAVGGQRRHHEADAGTSRDYVIPH